MGNEIKDELEGQLNEILEKKYPELAKDIEDAKVYLDWGEPDLYEHSNRDSLEVDVLNTDTDKLVGKISFDVKITWSNDLGFGGWEEIEIIPSTIDAEYENK